MPTSKHEGDLSTYPTKYLRCRGDRQHTYRLETDKKIVRNARGRVIEFTRTKVCILCEKKRHTKVKILPSGRFEIMAHQYEDPEGYAVRRTNPLDPRAVQDAMLLAELTEALPAADLERLLSKRPSTAKKKVRSNSKQPHLRAV